MPKQLRTCGTTVEAEAFGGLVMELGTIADVAAAARVGSKTLVAIRRGELPPASTAGITQKRIAGSAGALLRLRDLAKDRFPDREVLDPVALAQAFGLPDGPGLRATIAAHEQEQERNAAEELGEQRSRWRLAEGETRSEVRVAHVNLGNKFARDLSAELCDRALSAALPSATRSPVGLTLPKKALDQLIAGEADVVVGVPVTPALFARGIQVVPIPGLVERASAVVGPDFVLGKTVSTWQELVTSLVEKARRQIERLREVRGVQTQFVAVVSGDLGEGLARAMGINNLKYLEAEEGGILADDLRELPEKWLFLGSTSIAAILAGRDEQSGNGYVLIEPDDAPWYPLGIATTHPSLATAIRQALMQEVFGAALHATAMLFQAIRKEINDSRVIKRSFDKQSLGGLPVESAQVIERSMESTESEESKESTVVSSRRILLQVSSQGPKEPQDLGSIVNNYAPWRSE